MWKRAKLLAAAAITAAAAVLAEPAAAQQTANRVEAYRDWSVFTADDGGPVCWVVTQPQSSTATRGGQRVQVRRGDIYLMVAIRPQQGVANEVSVVSGYPYREGSTTRAEIGSTRLEMFTRGENAWLRPGQDDGMVEAMKRGSVAVVTGTSSRGTVTTDRFSLLGFTDALNAARGRCS
ncbi:MAG: invasion associated locus B family protein [Pseudomonadota bacterium]